MALRASSTGLVVLCFAALLLVSSFAAETSGAHDAGRTMERRLYADGDYEPAPAETYDTPSTPTYYGPPNNP
ncbi:unnamed protein product [Urochloa decumbens]|uniref:Uncharacterized protein n=1 Tax=Urochloa decumbens TaxID=240449 RepID=A0ABC9BC39_9POAL